jgi:hypothetical protein
VIFTVPVADALSIYQEFMLATLHVAPHVSSSFLLLVQKKRSKEKDTRAEAFLQLTLQNRPSQPKGGPRLPAFFTVNPPYASTSGGFPATPEFGFVSSVKHVYILPALPEW